MKRNNFNFNFNFERFQKRNPNDNSTFNCLVISDAKHEQIKRAEAIAQRLCEKFNNQDFFAYYCRIALKLPEDVIWKMVEQAEAGRHPGKLFSFLCKRAGV